MGVLWNTNQSDMLISIAEVAVSRVTNPGSNVKDWMEVWESHFYERYNEEPQLQQVMHRFTDLLLDRIDSCADIAWPLFDGFLPKQDPLGQRVLIERVEVLEDMLVCVVIK